MLGKLIKYDMKSLNRFLLLIHAFLLLSAVLIRVFLTQHIIVTNDKDTTILMLIFILYFMIIAGASWSTYLIIAVRFYKNLFSDEGYLTHTLPVTRGQHLLSKTIAGTIWGCIDMILIFVTVYIVGATPFVIDFYHEYKADILSELGFVGKYKDFSLTGFVALMLLLACIGTVTTIVEIYASVALGQLFSGHRVLGAVASYFALTMIFSIISCAILALFGVMSTVIVAETTDTSFNFLEYMLNVMGISTVLSLITVVLLYILTYYLMRKKVNLA